MKTRNWMTGVIGTAMAIAGAANAQMAATYMGAECNAGTSAFADRASFYASAVLNSPVFNQCMTQRLNGRSGQSVYKTCPGPDPSGSPNNVNGVVAATYAGNHLQLSCSYTTAGNTAASAHLGSWLKQSNAEIDLADDWLENNYTYWRQNYWRENTWLADKPWNWRAGDLVHEALHQQGYDHPNPPCANYEGGKNSAPYIVGGCIDHIIDYSPCGSLDACADPDDVRLPGAWDSTRDLPSNNAATCQCVPSGRRRIALRTSNARNYLSAINGGGGAADAHALGAGSWESLHMIDLDGGRLLNGNKVLIRAQNGNLLRAVSGRLKADGTSTQAMRIQGGWAGSPTDPTVFTVVTNGTVTSGAQVALKAFDGRFVVAEQGGGGAVNVNRTAQGAWETFTVDAPRRAWLVRLRSQNQDVPARHVTYDGITAALRVSSAEETDFGAFWILDQNGGTLQSGDTISFESDEFPGKFVSSCGGLGTVSGGADYVSWCSKFRIDIPGATPGTAIVPGSTVSLRSGQNTYLTAVPSGFPNAQTVQNTSTAVTSHQRFTLVKVGAWTVD